MAAKAGVIVMAYDTDVTVDEIRLSSEIPVLLQEEEDLKANANH